MGRGARVARQAEEKRRGASTLWHEVEAVFAIAGACYLAISFLTYSPSHSGSNAGGPVGYLLADLFVAAFGVAAFLVPASIALVATLVLRGVPIALSLTRGGALTAQLLLVATALAVARGPGHEAAAGGWIGGLLAFELRRLFSTAGAVMIVLTGLLLSAMIVTGGSLVGGVRSMARRAAGAGQALGASARRLWPRRSEDASEVPPIAPVRARERDARGREPREGEPREREANARERELRKSRVPAPPPILVNEPEPKPDKGAKKESKALKQEEFQFAPGAHYELPPLSFLDAPVDTGVRIDEDALIASSRILQSKLADFGVEGKVVAVRPGPVITTFEFEPAPGVKVNRIVTLADDLSMALRAHSVRILAPIPGKPVVGIEVSNPRREKVYLREIIAERAVPALGVEAHARARQGHDGQHPRRRPREDAASPHGRRDRHRQVGVAERHHHERALQGEPRRRALHHDRSEDARAVDLRQHPAPARPGRHRSEEGGVRARQRDAADGRALPHAARQGRAEHRQLQPHARAPRRRRSAPA